MPTASDRSRAIAASVVVAAMLLVPVLVQAQVANGYFETKDLTGWTIDIHHYSRAHCVYDSDRGSFACYIFNGNSYQTSGGPPSRWVLVSQQMTLPVTAESLRFSMRVPSPNLSDVGYVFIKVGATYNQVFYIGDGAHPWAEYAADISAWAGQTVEIVFGGRRNSGGSYRSPQVLFDDVRIECDPPVANDVGIRRISRPFRKEMAGTAVFPQVWVENYGSDAALNFDVNCTIVDTATGHEFYNNGFQIASLASGDSMLVTFAVPWIPEESVYCVSFKTSLSGDEDLANDSMAQLSWVGWFACEIANGDFEAGGGSFDDWTCTGPHFTTLVTWQGSHAARIYITDGTSYASGGWEPNGYWELIYQNIFIHQDAESLAFYVEVLGGGYNDCGTVWIEDNGLYTRLFKSQRSHPWTREKVDITHWQGKLVSIILAGQNANGFGDHSANIWFDDAFLGPLASYDVAAASIQEPTGTVQANTDVTPTATWHNYHTAPSRFMAWFILEDPTAARVYIESTYVVGLPAGADTTLQFPVYNVGATEGDWTARCSTLAAGDVDPDNDTLSGTFTVQSGNPDMGIMSINAPAGYVDTAAVVTPEITVHNYGDIEVTFSAWLTISDTTTDVEIYNETTAVAGVPVGSNAAVTFPNWTAPALEGPYATWAELIITDLNADNDTLSGSFNVGGCPPVTAGWLEMEKIPLLPGSKAVKRGAWTTYNDGDKLIYATKGYKTTDFYAYYPLEDSWDNLTGMPYTKHSNPKWARKVPRKGSKGVADDDNYVYVTQGNNTLGFWRYGIAQDSWEELKDVPVGPDRKKVKGGTDLAYLVIDDTGWVYCLKGYRCEFYRYNTATELWSTALDPAPKGTRGKWDKGSWLVAENDAATTLYAHKAKYNELWSYDVAEDSWNAKLTGIPFVGLQGRKKKSKDGGSADWFDGEIYALKGGNTNEFWKYLPVGDTWTELDSMPTMGTTGKKKRVKYGADIVNYAGCPAFFTLKGNKTFEWWRYGVAEASRLTLHASRRTVQASSLERTASSVLHIAPNPLAGGYATVRYSLPKAGPATLTVVDVAGRTVSSRTVLASRSGAVSLDLRSLSAGVYLVRLEADGFEITGKLIVQH